MWYFLLAIFFGVAAIFIGWYSRALRYWHRKGVYNPKPSLIFGNIKDAIFQKQSLGEIFRDIYFDFKSKNLRHGGAYFFAKPEYIPIDLKLIKAILQNDFQYFNSHGGFVDEAADPLSGHIFSLEGHKWRRIRNILTPTFTPGKMKMMFQTLVDCTYSLEALLDKSAETNPIDVKDIMGRFTTDMIGSCAFGIDINSMENANTDFRKYGTKAFDSSLADPISQLALFLIPHSILRFFKFSLFSSDIIEFFHKIVKENIKYREDNNIYRKDLMHLMIQLKTKNSNKATGDNKTVEDEGLTVNEIAAQSFVFFLAGFESSSATLNFASYELAVNLDIQKMARQQINEVFMKYNDQLTFEAVMEMSYLDKVIYETLRKYPPLPFLFRKCLKNYKVPDTDLEIEAGTAVQIPVLGIHYDPEYYPDPYKFDPERFGEEAKNTRPQFTWLPFGEGPRICLGQRFGILQMKVGLITLLRNYKITLNKETKSPLVLKKTGFVTSSEGNIWIDLKKIG